MSEFSGVLGAFMMQPCTFISPAESPSVSSKTVIIVCNASVISVAETFSEHIQTVWSYDNATTGLTNFPIRAHGFTIYPLSSNIFVISAVCDGSDGVGTIIFGFGVGIERMSFGVGWFRDKPVGDIGRTTSMCGATGFVEF